MQRSHYDKPQVNIGVHTRGYDNDNSNNLMTF